MKLLAVLAFIASTTANFLQTIPIELETVPDKNLPRTRIVNGQEASPKQYPHQALLIIGTLQGSFQCGGSLISSLWVLTATHCIIG